MTKQTVIAFDYGTKNIGAAVGQSIIQSATELPTLRAKDGIPDWDEIGALLTKWQPNTVIVGLPLNMDDSESEMAIRARKFGNRLNGRFGVKVLFVDERLSTQEAKEIAAERGHKGNYGKIPIDSIAAAVLLTSWWDEQITT